MNTLHTSEETTSSLRQEPVSTNTVGSAATDVYQTNLPLLVDEPDGKAAAKVSGAAATSLAAGGSEGVSEAEKTVSSKAETAVDLVDGEALPTSEINPAALSTLDAAIPAAPNVPAKPSVDVNQACVDFLREQPNVQKDSAAPGESTNPKEAPATPVQSPPDLSAARHAGKPESLAVEWARMTADLQPPPKPQTLRQKVKSRRALIRASKRKDLSWEQLAGVLAKVKITIKPSYLRKVVGGSRRRSRPSATTGSSG